MDSTETVYTTKELAEKANLDPSRIRQLLIEGRVLHGFKFGRDWAVPVAEAERWLAERK